MSALASGSALTARHSSADDSRHEPVVSTDRRPHRIALILGFACLAAHGVMHGLGAGDDGILPQVSLAAVYALASMACLVGSRSRAREAPAWRLFGLAFASYGTTAVIYTIEPGVAERFPSAADLGLFAFYPLVMAAVVLLIRARFPDLRAVLWLDAAIGALATAALAVQIIAAALPSQLDRAAAGQLLYAAGDYALLGLLAATYALSGRRAKVTVGLLAIGAAALALGDTLYVFDAVARRDPSLLSEVCWALGMLTMAASRVGRRQLVDVTARHVRGHPIIPLVASSVLLPIALLNDVSHPVELGLGAAGLCAVVIRLTVGLAENAKLAATVQEDLQQLTHAESRVRSAIQERDAILNAAAAGICRTNNRGEITFVNAAAAELLGREPEDLLGLDAHAILHPADAETCAPESCPLYRATRGAAPHRTDDGRFWRADATPLPVSYASTPVAAEIDGAGAVCVFNDATERKRAEAERDALLRRVQTLALTDELTGLANRRAWELALPRELARAARSREPLSVAMIDIDGLKSINDVHGHQAGSDAIKHAAAAWSRVLRDTDLIARFGGDEFAAVLPSSALEEAVSVGERLRLAVGQAPTASIGIAQWDGKEAEDELVARADAALYEAKRQGRNRVAASASAPRSSRARALLD